MGTDDNGTSEMKIMSQESDMGHYLTWKEPNTKGRRTRASVLWYNAHMTNWWTNTQAEGM